jgi:hypothetical protein
MNLNDKYICTICGKDSKFNTMPDCPEGQIIIRDRVCFECAFWTNKIENPLPNRAIIEGKHYTVNAGTAHKGPFLGFGGRRVKVRYFDGYDVESNNIWHQGEIPEHFKDRLPNNAEFVSGL